MTGSMYSAVSGLKAHMSALSVIGNNVSNVNTLGYKATRYTFNEALYSTNRNGSDGSTVLGGRNPGQIGYGANIGTIDLDMSSKNYSPTGKPLDTMIDGDGFFLVGDKVVVDNNGDAKYGINLATDTSLLKKMDMSRLGNFTVDPNGYLVDGNGSVVWGFQEVECSAEELQYINTKYAATLGAGATDTTRSGAPGSTDEDFELDDYHNFVYSEDGTKILQATRTSGIMTAIRLPKISERYIDNSQTNYQPVEPATVASQNFPPNFEKLTIAYAKEVTATGQKRINSTYGANAQASENLFLTNTGRRTTNMSTDPSLQAAQVMDADDALNFENSEGRSIIGAENYARLQPEQVSINERTGALTVMTADGQVVSVGQLALAKVTNPEGVTHVDGRYYQAREGAGEMRVTTMEGFIDKSLAEDLDVAGIQMNSKQMNEVNTVRDAGESRLITGGLESSGTDLATEITNMVTVQRGYQANTRVVTVTDSMLEELVNLKR